MLSSRSYHDWEQIAGERWLSPEELSFILNNFENIGFPKNYQKPSNPQDGSIYIYDRTVVPDFKLDGVEWTKKKDSNKVYEQFIKLRGGGTHAVTGLYCAAADNPLFRRRCYRLARGEGGGVSPEHLVHYRDCSSSEASSKKIHAIQKSMMLSHDDVMAKSSLVPEEGLSSGRGASGICFADDGLSAPLQNPVAGLGHASVEFDSLEDSALVHEMLEALNGDDFSDMEEPSLSGGNQHNQAGSQSCLSNEGSQQSDIFSRHVGIPEQAVHLIDMSPSTGSQQGGTKVLICFTGVLPANTSIKVLFTPDPDVHIDHHHSHLAVAWSAAELLSPSVVRCLTPPRQAGHGGRCRVALATEENIVLSYSSLFFEYSGSDATAPPPPPHTTSPSSGPKKRQSRSEDDGLLGTVQRERPDSIRNAGAGESDVFAHSSGDTGTHKIRIVERMLVQGRGGVSLTEGEVESTVKQAMTGLDLGLGQRSKDPDTERNDGWLDDAQLLGLSSSDLESLMDQFLMRVVQQLVNLASVDEDLLAGEELDGLDSSGYSLLHYCCLFNLTSLVTRLIDRGANINLKTRCSSTALHLSAMSGHEAAVIQLIEAGALVNLPDSNQLLASDVAEQRGFPHIKVLLDNAATHQCQSGALTAQSKHRSSADAMTQQSQFTGPSPTLRNPAGSRGASPEHCKRLSEDDAAPPLSSSPNSGHDSTLSMNNMALLHGALSSLSLTDKCALSLTLQNQSTGVSNERRTLSVLGVTGGDSIGQGHSEDFEVQSVLSENDVETLDLAMSMMGPQELSAVEDEVKVIQSNVRTWLLRKNYTNLRDAAKTLQVAWRGHRSASSGTRDKPAGRSSVSIASTMVTKHDSVCGERTNNLKSSRINEIRATRGSNTKSIDACAATLQAATRGMLARRSFQRAKKQTMASLVIFQWWVQSKAKSNNGNSSTTSNFRSHGGLTEDAMEVEV